MADVDEDAPIRPNAVVDEDIDLSDETQDFRFLAAIGADGGKIPKRGEKDFEPHATALQSNTLAASRLAMHNALSVERYHNFKGHTIAIYHPETNMAYSQTPKGVWVSKMGQVLPADKDPLGNDELRGQRLWLQPEEALYLIERGTIDIRWPAQDESPDELGLSMSLQAAYSVFIGDEESHNGGLTFERYSVYTALRRVGYTVIRAPSWTETGLPLSAECFPPVVQPTWWTGLYPRLTWTRIWSTNSIDDQDAALVQPGLYRSYREVYRRLSLIPFYDPTLAIDIDSTSTSQPPFQVTYHVFKPNNTKYRKTLPGSPDFRIAVINARETPVPTMEQLARLMDTVPYAPPPDSPHFYAKLKHGYKNVILAVVDQGVTSYLRMSDAAFGKEKIFEREFKGAGGKRGGFKGGRGRGRGR
ncbi:hypothetical protein AMS68_005186 [Peltaster fructicola]|uniref:tRNA-splicing endonuclease subunit Sen54 N-terminal domain-containing protein n=1 Tax=Peltaster fructicola TaxID=286661 RepID=A0A6H0XYH2_9PEZI|nr:hypothetical protein AMS68_005186 [Peltaster fructicola]